MAERTRSGVAASWLVAFGAVGAVLAFALFLPSACGNTDMVILEPDGNDYECSSLLIRDQDSVRGPTPGTGPGHTGLDFLQTRMMLRALGFAAVPLGIAAGGLWWLRRGRRLLRRPRSRAAAVIYILSAAAAAAASLQAAFGVLGSPVAVVPLLIPVVVPLARFLARPDRMWIGWAALAVQVVLVVPLALPIGFLYAPSALLLFIGLIVEAMSRIRRKTAPVAAAPSRT